MQYQIRHYYIGECLKMTNNNEVFNFEKTGFNTAQGKPIYLQIWFNGLTRYRVRCRVAVLVPDGKRQKTKFVPSWRDLDPVENEQLFESDPYSFSAFVTSLRRICKWIMPHYTEYRQRGLDAARSFDKAVINYEERNNSTLDGVWLREAYSVITAEDNRNTRRNAG